MPGGEDAGEVPNPASFKPGSLGCHEALHLTHVMVEMLDRHLGDHPSILANPEWKAHLDRAVEELATLYQAIGAAHLPLTAPHRRADDAQG
jgi:hypothetical protein